MVQEEPARPSADGSSPTPAPGLRRFPLAAFVVFVTLLAVAPFLVRTLIRFGALQFPLDDPFIYLQYARNLAQGYLYEYWPGDGYTAGCTSALYPWLLVPGFWLGLEGAQLVTWSWGVSLLLILASAALAARLGRMFAGTAGALGAVVTLMATGSWLWGALSGLEIGLFSALCLLAVWLLGRDAGLVGGLEGTLQGVRRLEPSILEAQPYASGRTASRASSIALWLTAAGLGVARPEGFSIAVVLIACVLLREGRRTRPLAWLVWPLALLPWYLVGTLNEHYAGQFVPNTAVHKSVMFYPRQSLEHVVTHAFSQLWRLVKEMTLMKGGRLMLPMSLATVVVALGWLSKRVWGELRARRTFPATFLLLAILGGVASALVARGPAQFNRYYHVVFALVSVTAGLALPSILGWLGRRLPGRAGQIVPVALVLALLGGAVDQSGRWSHIFVRASGEIVDQQIKAALWMDGNLPKDAHLLLNDVGAMAYFTNRRTYDVVGLTTNHQAPWFNEGPGAVIEKFERLDPKDLPGYFTIYPSWIDLTPVIDRELFRASIGPAVVAGGRHAVVYRADWRRLHSGDKPETPLPEGRILDRIDVADLDDEAAHRYVLHMGRRERGSKNNTSFGLHTGAREVLDGGRQVRVGEGFDVSLPSAQQVRLRARLEAPGPVRLEVTVNGQPAGQIDVPRRDGFLEVDHALPTLAGKPGTHRIEIRKVQGDRYHPFHYWIWGV